MFTLRNEKKFSRNPFFIYLGVTIFCAIFGCVYETFSHNVISLYMVLGFLWPLCGGLLVYALFYFIFKNSLPSMVASYLYNAGLATLTVGSYYHGIIEIYGTTRPFYVYFYLILGFVLLGAGIISYFVGLFLKVKSANNNK